MGRLASASADILLKAAREHRDDEHARLRLLRLLDERAAQRGRRVRVVVQAQVQALAIGRDAQRCQDLLAQLAHREVLYLQLHRPLVELGRVQDVVEQAQHGARRVPRGRRHCEHRRFSQPAPVPTAARFRDVCSSRVLSSFVGNSRALGGNISTASKPASAAF